jgi:hypothetical protein
MATTVTAQPYYARGDFNAWGISNIMTDMGGGLWQGTVSGLTPGDMPEYKIADENWTVSWPGSNGRVAVDAAGEINFNLMLGTFADGWSPAADRVGYADPGQHGWDIMGSFNSWSSPVVLLTDMGGGLYSGQAVVPVAGNYEFKFRKEGDWAITIGDNFGNSAANIPITTNNANDVVTFELDLPNGRWRVTAVPAPGALVLLPLAGLFTRRRR